MLDLSILQPRQIEWLYWLSKGFNAYGAADKMALSNKSIPLRQRKLRERLGVGRYCNLEHLAKAHKKWLKENVNIRGTDLCNAIRLRDGQCRLEDIPTFESFGVKTTTK